MTVASEVSQRATRAALLAREQLTRRRLPTSMRMSGLLALGLLAIRRNKQIVQQNRDCIVYPHMGLGDQISMYPTLKALAETRSRVYLPVRPSYMNQVRDLYASLPNVRLLPLSGRVVGDRKTLWRLGDRLGLPLLTAGHEAYALIHRAFPDHSLNWHLNAACGVATDDLIRRDLGGFVKQVAQERVPSGRYAFVDHHPGTEREIPEGVLEDISRRGLAIVENPRAVPLTATLSLMQHAEELHLVSSAPLCMALTFDAGARYRYRYRVRDEFPLLLDYPMDWQELSVSNGTVERADRTLEFSNSLRHLSQIEITARRWIATELSL